MANANHQNGQGDGYYHQNHPPPTSQGLSHLAAYSHQQSLPEHPSQRRSSFDAGDDATFLDGGIGQDRGMSAAGAYPAYPVTNQMGSQRGRGSPNVAQSSRPVRTTSHATSPMSGYQHQYQPAHNHSYNPSQFAHTQSQYNPQAYGSPQLSHSSSPYQPYNPAAYQPSNLHRNPSVTYTQPSGYYVQSGGYNFHPAPPPPPSRQGDSSYVQQQSLGGYQNESTYSPPYASSQTTPYSSPAPPPPIHDHNSYNSTASVPRPYSHASANVQQDSYYTPPFRPTPENQPTPPLYTAFGNRHASFASRSSTQSPHQPSTQPFVPSPPSRHPSQLSQASAPSPRRTYSNRHPQARPLPGPPSESESDSDYFGTRNGAPAPRSQNHDETGYDDLMKEVDAAINQGGTDSATTRPSPQYLRAGHRSSTQDRFEADTLFPSSSPQPLVSPDEIPTHGNGHMALSGSHHINNGALTDDSDAEAAAGLAAMQAAEEQEAAEEARRRSGSTSLFSGYGSHRQARAEPGSNHDVSSDSDYANVDIGFAAGGYETHMHYGDEQLPSNYALTAEMPDAENFRGSNPRMDSLRSSGRSSDGRESQLSGYDSIPGQDAIHPFPPFRHPEVARVDTGGTGGLTEPSPHPRRLSFEDGDEVTLLDSEIGRTSGSVSPSKDSMPDLFYHPGMSPQRPLPPAPSASDPGTRLPHLVPAGVYGTYGRNSVYDNLGQSYPSAPEAYQQSLLNPSLVPRSTSLASNRSTPRADQPIRSKTDADRARLLKQQLLGRPGSDVYDSSMSQSAVTLDLPTIPRKKFNPVKLSTEQYKRCSEPWALSAIVAWLRDLAEDESDLREHAVAEGIVALFTHKVPTMNTTEAETLGARVVKEMFEAGALVKEEEWVKFGSGDLTGVLFQLTGTGCYSPKVHLYASKGRCYSYHCIRTLKKVDLSLPVAAEKKSDDWATFYNLKKEDIASQPKKEVERQNILHEIVTTEMLYIAHMDILRVLYRDQLAISQPPIIQAKKLPSFLKEVFGLVDAVKKVNEDYLLAQLKYRQNEQGPFIVGFSDIFREWIRKAKSVYVEYAAGFPHANYLVRREAERNILFKQFLDQARDDKRSNRLSWDSYLKDPITRLQRYGLLLQTVHKNMPKDSEEKMNLQFAVDEIRAATFECNQKVEEMEKKMELLELSSKLRLRKGMEKEVELNLDHLGREIIIRGDLQRAGGKGFQWVDTHAILFDHYLVLAKTIINRDSSGGRKYDIYDVSKVPVPMDLIVLESTNDDPVVKSSVKGIGAVTSTITPRGQMPSSDARLGRNASNYSAGPGTLTHTNTNTSLNSKESSGRSIVPTTVLESNSKDEKIMYPFKVKHLGKSEVYTLYAPSAQNRQEWCEAIIEAKTRHAASLFAQNAEPFRLKVLADTAFGYDSVAPLSKRIVIKGTPLDRAIKEAERKCVGEARPGPVSRAAVNCATVFNQPPGKLMCAVGTDYGVFISEYEDPRGWTRAVQMTRITQVAVFEEFNLFLLISDKSLIAYHLDAVCRPSGTAAPQTQDASSRRAPQKLSGTKDVGFFATGRMKDRALVFYKKRDGISSTFKVLEPVLQKSSTTRSRFLPTSTRRGQIEFFREYDEFYIPADCYSINLFHSSLAISTSRGVEVLTLDKKQPWSVPNLRSDQPDAQSHLSSIASRIKDLRPLGMFRLGESEFLVAFEECAVYVNKHGDVSRGVVMEFVGRAKSACLYGQYLILFDDDFVEIRNAMNGRMKQVIAGKDIKMLDDGGGGSSSHSIPTGGLGGGLNGSVMQGFYATPRTVKICMQHPDYERSQVVVELVENEGQKE